MSISSFLFHLQLHSLLFATSRCSYETSFWVAICQNRENWKNDGNMIKLIGTSWVSLRKWTWRKSSWQWQSWRKWRKWSWSEKSNDKTKELNVSWKIGKHEVGHEILEHMLDMTWSWNQACEQIPFFNWSSPTDILSDTYSWHNTWHSIWLTYIVTLYLAFYLTYVLTFYIWHPLWRSIWHLARAVEARQCPLSSGIRSCRRRRRRRRKQLW